MNIKQYLKKKREIINQALDGLVPDPDIQSRLIYKAISHALKGGKRIRPILCLACAEAAGAKEKNPVKAACAIEMVHAYSLIHDDLPCMDDDDYRRGRLSVHKKFGIANAVLAGDALLTEAFNVISSATADNDINIEMVKILSHAAGISGMIAGQAADINLKTQSLAMQEYINIHKTGALIAASCKIGAIAGGANPRHARLFLKFGEYIGLVFQATDDMLDNEGTSGLLGKKRTLDYARELTDAAKEAVSCFGKRANTLCRIADFILNRTC